MTSLAAVAGALRGAPTSLEEARAIVVDEFRARGALERAAHNVDKNARELMQSGYEYMATWWTRDYGPPLVATGRDRFSDGGRTPDTGQRLSGTGTGMDGYVNVGTRAAPQLVRSDTLVAGSPSAPATMAPAFQSWTPAPTSTSLSRAEWLTLAGIALAAWWALR